LGYRISPIINAVPAWAEDGKVYADYGIFKEGVSVPIGDLKFPKQLNNVMTDNVCLYLYNAEYKLVVRYDGSGCLATLDDFLVRSFLYEGPSKRYHYSWVQKGTLNILGRDEFYALNKVDIEPHKVMMSVQGKPMAFIFEINDSFAFYDYRVPTLPLFFYDERQNKLYIEEYGTKNRREINCEVYKSSSYSMLGGAR